MAAIIKQLGKIEKGLTKSEIEFLASQDVKEIAQNEQYDLLKVFIELKRYSIYLNQLIEGIKIPAMEKAKQRCEKEFNYAEARVVLTKKVAYDYSVDKIWSELNVKLLDTKELMKRHQDTLKELKNGAGQIIDKESGEILLLTPPIKKEEEIIMIKL
jgi:hypothetical protein